MRGHFDDAHFLRGRIIDVDAAVVGISKVRWLAIESSATVQRAAERMRNHHFDVLPVYGGETREYFTTTTWNDFSSVERRRILYKDVIPLHTAIRDVIRGFAVDGRTFYFLEGGEGIAGLISVANLNCRAVKVYLFGLLSELEIRLGDVLETEVPRETLFDLTLGAHQPGRRQLRERYCADRQSGFDPRVVDYLYLRDFITVVRDQELYGHLGYTEQEFESAFDGVPKLRNCVAHPNQSVVNADSPVEHLWARIARIEETLFRLRQVKALEQDGDGR